MPDEIWKPVTEPGYEEFYSVSNLGRVRREAPGRNTYKGRIRKHYKNPNGYLVVNLKVRNKASKQKVHRLVAKAFLSQPTPKHEVNHKNSNRQDNTVQNLEWVTHSENMLHGFVYGFNSQVGVRNSRAKLTEEDVKEIRRLAGRVSQKELATRFGVSCRTIRHVVVRSGWKHVE